MLQVRLDAGFAASVYVQQFKKNKKQFIILIQKASPRTEIEILMYCTSCKTVNPSTKVCSVEVIFRCLVSELRGGRLSLRYGPHLTLWPFALLIVYGSLSVPSNECGKASSSACTY